MILSIKPLKEVGALKFPMTKDEVESLLGKPNREETMSNGRFFGYFSGQIESVTYHEDHGLVGASISCAPVYVYEKDILSLSFTELKKWLTQKNITFKVNIDEQWDELEDVEIPCWGITI